MRENTISELKPPIKYDGYTFEDQLEQAYDIFKNSFMNDDVRPKYKGKFIYFDRNRQYKKDGMSFTLSYPERFLHLVSLGEDDKFNMYPCTNEITYEECENKCGESQPRYIFALINRCECLYRLSRIHWIPQILNLANAGNKNITEWEETDLDTKGGKITNAFIRYNRGMDDYVIVMVKKSGIYYFTTGYPVLIKDKKKTFNKRFIEFSGK